VSSKSLKVAIRFIQVSPICWGRLATKCPRCCGHLSQADSYLAQIILIDIYSLVDFRVHGVTSNGSLPRGRFTFLSSDGLNGVSANLTACFPVLVELTR
jgi:hypothetical protein